MKQILEFFAEDLLPTRLMRVTLLGFLALLPASILLPDRLESIGLKVEAPYITTVRIISGLLVFSCGSIALLVQSVAWIRSQRMDLSRFREFRGSFLKRKDPSGFHKCVYCGSCRKPAAAPSTQSARKYKCSCGWVSDFTVGEFLHYFPDIENELN